MNGTTASKDKLARSESEDSKVEKQDSRDVKLHAISVDTHDIYDGDDSAVDPVYQAKARILNDAFQEIGMGKYQVRTHCAVTDCNICLTASIVVLPLHRSGFRVVLVSGCFPADLYTQYGLMRVPPEITCGP